MQRRPYRAPARVDTPRLRARPVADYAFSDSSEPAAHPRSRQPVHPAPGTSHGHPSEINRNTRHDPAVIAVRVLDDAHMTWVAAEVESEHALRAWFDADASQDAGAYQAYRAAVDREDAAARDLQRLSELTQPAKSGSRSQ
jgi:hypothetical protein